MVCYKKIYKEKKEAIMLLNDYKQFSELHAMRLAEPSNVLAEIFLEY